MDNKTLGSAEHAAGHRGVNPGSATAPAGGDGDSQKQSYSCGGERKPGSSSKDGSPQTEQKVEKEPAFGDGNDAL